MIDTAKKWHHQTYSSRYNICQQNTSLEGKFLGTYWPCIENKCDFIKTKLVDEMEDLKKECCEFRSLRRRRCALKVTQCLVVYLQGKTMGWFEFQKYSNKHKS